MREYSLLFTRRNKDLFRFCTRFHFLVCSNDCFFVEDINLLDYRGGLEYTGLETELERGELRDGAFEGDALRIEA